MKKKPGLIELILEAIAKADPNGIIAKGTSADEINTAIDDGLPCLHGHSSKDDCLKCSTIRKFYLEIFKRALPPKP